MFVFVFQEEEEEEDEDEEEEADYAPAAKRPRGASDFLIHEAGAHYLEQLHCFIADTCRSL